MKRSSLLWLVGVSVFLGFCFASIEVRNQLQQVDTTQGTFTTDYFESVSRTVPISRNDRIEELKQPEEPVAVMPNRSELENYSAVSNNCASLKTCSTYQSKLDAILQKMRTGYKAGDYQKLEDARNKWKEKIAEECDCYRTNSF